MKDAKLQYNFVGEMTLTFFPTKIIFGLVFVHSENSYANGVITYILLNHVNLLLQFLVVSFKMKSQSNIFHYLLWPFKLHFQCT